MPICVDVLGDISPAYHPVPKLLYPSMVPILVSTFPAVPLAAKWYRHCTDRFMWSRCIVQIIGNRLALTVAVTFGLCYCRLRSGVSVKLAYEENPNRCIGYVYYKHTLLWGSIAWRFTSMLILPNTQPSIQAQIKESVKPPRHWPLCGELTGDRWIPRTNDQLRVKCFHLMTSS